MGSLKVQALHPDQFAGAPPKDLISAASHGLIGLDHRLLRTVLSRFDEFLPELVAAGMRQDEVPVPLYAFLIDIFRHRPSAAAIPFLIECIRREAGEIEDEVVEAFGQLGGAAVEPLLALCQELKPEQRGDTAFLLAGLGVRDPRIYARLMEFLAANPGEAAFLLGIYGDPAAIPELERTLETRADLDAEAIEDLREAVVKLSRPEVGDRWAPYDIFADYPEEAGPNTDALTLEDRLLLTQSPSTEYRKEAIDSFLPDEMDLNAVRQRVLELAEGDADAALRGKAWSKLGSVAVEDKGIREAMRRRLEDESAPPEERAGALAGLAHGELPEIVSRILVFYERPETRAEALEAMWRALDPDYAPYFARHLEDPDVNVRREAITGAGVLRMSSECRRLEKLFLDEEVRIDALRAYALAAPGKVSAMHARQVLARIEDLAGGLSQAEGDLVCSALDMLLEAHGKRPVFFPPQGEDAPEEASWRPAGEKAGRNDPCPCGSGKKYKKCCGP